MARGDPRAAAKAEKRAHPHVSASTSPPAANGWLRSSVLEVSVVDCGCPSIFHTGSTRLNRSEEHTSELQSLMRISSAVFCLKKKTEKHYNNTTSINQLQRTNNMISKTDNTQ